MAARPAGSSRCGVSAVALAQLRAPSLVAAAAAAVADGGGGERASERRVARADRAAAAEAEALEAMRSVERRAMERMTERLLATASVDWQPQSRSSPPESHRFRS